MKALIISRACAALSRSSLSGRSGASRLHMGQYSRERSVTAKSSFASDLSSFLQQPNVVIIDVRSPQEHHEARIEDAKLIPVQEIPERLGAFPVDIETPIVVFCRIGQRSGLAKNFLEQVGYNNVFNGMTLETVASATGAEIVSGDPARQ